MSSPLLPSSRVLCRALLIDNYDSYSFNLFHLIAQETGCEPILVQNDDFDGDWDSLIQHLEDASQVFHCIVVGPGPGTPEDAKYLGLSKAAVSREDVQVPVLGVCLGMQAIAFEYGGRVVRAPRPMHGRLSNVLAAAPSRLFDQMDFPFEVVRYHSLCVDMRGTEQHLMVTATASDDDVVMALEHRKRLLFGVQFHPESICAGKQGPQIIANFVRIARQTHNSRTLQRSLVAPAKRIRSVNGYETFESPISNGDSNVSNVCSSSSNVSLNVTLVGNPHLVLAEDVFDALFVNAPCRAWFDSAMEHPRRGKFSILCKEGTFALGDRVEFFVDPKQKRMHLNSTHDELRDAGDCVLRVTRKGSAKPVLRRGRGCEPFSHLSNVLNTTKPSKVTLTRATTSSALPVQEDGGCDVLPFDFCCGYVGTLGYGLRKLCGVKHVPDVSGFVDVLEDDQAAPMQQQQQPDAAFFFCDQSIVFDHTNKQVYVLTLVDNAQKQHVQEQKEWTKQALFVLESRKHSTIIQEQASYRAPLANPLHLVPARTRKEYIQDVQTSLEYILQGETYEVCLTTQLVAAPSSNVDPNQLYWNLRRNNPAPFCALFAFDKTFALCCSSPERFLRVDRNGLVESRPIKGTVARGQTEEEDLHSKQRLETSEKDRAENLMIVDLVRNDLGRVCQIGTVVVPDLFVVESFRTVHQLVSTIQGNLKQGTNAVEAARAAFPPGSMTGSPKERTMQIIDTIETQERGFYSGALGFFSVSGAADFNVIIRTAVVEEQGKVTVGAGGAIVALSDPVQERQEMELKVRALGSCFRLDTEEEAV